jgi:hypothetical protein
MTHLFRRGPTLLGLWVLVLSATYFVLESRKTRLLQQRVAELQACLYCCNLGSPLAPKSCSTCRSLWRVQVSSFPSFPLTERHLRQTCGQALIPDISS